jgi:hypothetical protein
VQLPDPKKRPEDLPRSTFQRAGKVCAAEYHLRCPRQRKFFQNRQEQSGELI